VPAIRFYVDADLLALAKSLVAARYDVTFPGDIGDPRRTRPACPIGNPATKDQIWIPQVASLGFVVISRDRKISRKQAERRAVRDSGLRIVVLDTRRDPTTWGELGIVASQWQEIERLLDRAGPCIFLATRTTFRELPVL
jgi:PIN like domain